MSSESSFGPKKQVILTRHRLDTLLLPRLKFEWGCNLESGYDDQARDRLPRPRGGFSVVRVSHFPANVALATRSDVYQHRIGSRLPIFCAMFTCGRYLAARRKEARHDSIRQATSPGRGCDSAGRGYRLRRCPGVGRILSGSGAKPGWRHLPGADHVSSQARRDSASNVRLGEMAPGGSVGRKAAQPQRGVQ